MSDQQMSLDERQRECIIMGVGSIESIAPQPGDDPAAPTAKPKTLNYFYKVRRAALRAYLGVESIDEMVLETVLGLIDQARTEGAALAVEHNFGSDLQGEK